MVPIAKQKAILRNSMGWKPVAEGRGAKAKLWGKASWMQEFHATETGESRGSDVCYNLPLVGESVLLRGCRAATGLPDMRK